MSVESNEASQSNGAPPVKRFNVRCKEEKIELELEEGVVKEYIIREMMGAARDQYTSLMAKKAKFDGEGKLVGIIDASGIQAELIGRCLYDEGKLVPMGFIHKMSSTSQAELFEVCSKLNSLDKDAQELSKNG